MGKRFDALVLTAEPTIRAYEGGVAEDAKPKMSQTLYEHGMKGAKSKREKEAMEAKLARMSTKMAKKDMKRCYERLNSLLKINDAGWRLA